MPGDGRERRDERSRATVRSACRSMPSASRTGSGTSAVQAATVTRRACRSAVIHASDGVTGPAVRDGPQRPAEADDEQSDEHEPGASGHRQPPCINELVH